MRIAMFALAALCCSVSLADMPADASGPQQNEAAVKDQNQAQKTDENMAAAEQQVQVVEQPLHRHPTLLSMLRRNNDIRRRLGLAPHRINAALTKAAQDHANYMARSGDFQHYSNGGPQYRAQKYGFRGGVRENIAYNYRSVEDAFNVWQGSSGHYASIVSGTDEAGFGYAIGPGGAIYYVGVYGNAVTADQVGEDEATALALAAEVKPAEDAAKTETTPAAAEVKVDAQVVPAAAQEPATTQPSAAGATAAPAQPQPAVTTGQTNVRYYNSGNNRRFFRRRR